VIEGFALGGEFAGRVGEVCAGMQSEAVQWQMTDHAGTVRLVVNASGAVIDGHDTTPFGDEIIWGAARSTNAPQQKQGAQQSAETGAGTTGLYGWNETMRARYASLERDTPTGLEHTDWRKYDAWQGRWTTTDPSHQSMSVGNPQSFNRYAYVQNDPVNLVDPTGLDEEVIRIYTFAPRLIPDFNLLGFYNQYRTRYVIEDRFNERGARDSKPPQTPTPTPQVSSDCQSALNVANKTVDAIDRAYQSADILNRVGQQTGAPPKLLAAIGVRETGFQNLSQGGGNGRGIFQIDVGQNPNGASILGNTGAEATFAAKNLLIDRMNYHSDAARGYPDGNRNAELQFAAGIRDYNARHSVTRNIMGRPGATVSDLDQGTARDNYVTNVLNLMNNCFNR